MPRLPATFAEVVEHLRERKTRGVLTRRSPTVALPFVGNTYAEIQARNGVATVAQLLERVDAALRRAPGPVDAEATLLRSLTPLAIGPRAEACVAQPRQALKRYWARDANPAVLVSLLACVQVFRELLDARASAIAAPGSLRRTAARVQVRRAVRRGPRGVSAPGAECPCFRDRAECQRAVGPCTWVPRPFRFLGRLATPTDVGGACVPTHRDAGAPGLLPGFTAQMQPLPPAADLAVLGTYVAAPAAAVAWRRPR